MKKATNTNRWTFERYCTIHQPKIMQEDSRISLPSSPCVDATGDSEGDELHNNINVNDEDDIDDGFLDGLEEDVNLQGHFGSLSIDVEQKNDKIKIEQQKTHSDNDEEIKNNNDKNNSESKPEYNSIVEENLNNDNVLLDANDFALAIVKKKTGASDPQELSDWFKQKLQDFDEVDVKEKDNNITIADIPALIEYNTFFPWALKKTLLKWQVFIKKSGCFCVVFFL